MTETSSYSAEYTKRIQTKIASAVKTKLISNGVKNAESLSNIVTQMMFDGKKKNDIGEELDIHMENKVQKDHFLDWLFGYAKIVTPPTPAQSPIPDANEKKEDTQIKPKKQELHRSRSRSNSNLQLNQNMDTSNNSSTNTSSTTTTTTTTKTKTERHSYVKRNLNRSASQLDFASQVQKKIMDQAMAIAAVTENLTKKNDKFLDKKKSFRRESNSDLNSIFNNNNSSNTNGNNNSNNKFTLNGNDKTTVTRCTYWPNCNRGDSCKFWHPKELCPNLAHCPDGDNCLYIHPAVPQNKSSNKPKMLTKRESVSSFSNLSLNSNSSGYGNNNNNNSNNNKNGPGMSFSQNHTNHNNNNTTNGNNNNNNSNYSSSNNNNNGSTPTSNTYSVECKFGAKCTRADCKFSHPSPASMNKKAHESSNYAHAKSQENANSLTNSTTNNTYKLKTNHRVSSDVMAQNIICRFDPNCTRSNCKFAHTNK